jgi:hypothetical protein
VPSAKPKGSSLLHSEIHDQRWPGGLKHISVTPEENVVLPASCIFTGSSLWKGAAPPKSDPGDAGDRGQGEESIDETSSGRIVGVEVAGPRDGCPMAGTEPSSIMRVDASGTSAIRGGIQLAWRTRRFDETEKSDASATKQAKNG